jgi:Family of unknown function (DUF6082)
VKIKLVGSIAAIAMSITVLCSPFFLEWLVASRHLDWVSIGNAGQAYGAASAILSALAVLGVAITVLLQFREHSASQLQILRQQQFTLIDFAAKDPFSRAPLFGFDAAILRDLTEDQVRQWMFLAMVVGYARTGYLLGAFSEAILETEFFKHIFDTEVGRRWWSGSRYYMLTVAGQTKREKQFFRILDQVYEKALASGPFSTPFKLEKGANRSFGRSKLAKAIGLLAGGIVIGIAVTSKFDRFK